MARQGQRVDKPLGCGSSQDVVSVLHSQAPSLALETGSVRTHFLIKLLAPGGGHPVGLSPWKGVWGEMDWLGIVAKNAIDKLFETWLGVTEYSPMRFGKMHPFLEGIRIFSKTLHSD